MINYYRQLIRDVVQGRETQMLNPEERALGVKPIKDKDIRVQVPTLIIWGKEDSIVRYENTAESSLDKYIHPNVRNESRLVLLDGVTHWVSHEAPDRLNKELVDFLLLTTKNQ